MKKVKEYCKNRMFSLRVTLFCYSAVAVMIIASILAKMFNIKLDW